MSDPITNHDDSFAFGNIVKSGKVRGVLYDLGIGAGVAITGLNAAFAYLISQGAADYPLWLGATTAVYPLVAPYLFGVAKANLTT